jgi:site-specific recombinase XerD
MHGRIKKEWRLSKVFDLKESDLFNWDKTIQRLKTKNSPLNNYLNSLDSKIQQILTYPQSGKQANLNELVLLLKEAKKEDSNSNPLVVAYLKRYLNEEIETPIRKEGTKRNYRNAFNQLNNFLEYLEIKNIRIKDFKFKQAQDFKLFLEKDIDIKEKKNRLEKKVANKEVSSSTKIKNIKPVFEKAINEGLITENPFKKVKLNHHSDKSPSLTTAELRNIYQLNLKDSSELDLVKDLFLFMCFTGLSITDTLSLNNNDLKQTINSKLLLDTTREKTKSQIKQILIKPAEFLVNKYYGPERLSIPTLIFPKISDVDVNRKLKIIALFAGIKINLTTKIARITCREQLYEANINEPEIINLFMGWSPTIQDKVKMQYVSITDNKLLRFTSQLEIYYHNVLKENKIVQNEIISLAENLIW